VTNGRRPNSVAPYVAPLWQVESRFPSAEHVAAVWGKIVEWRGGAGVGVGDLLLGAGVGEFLGWLHGTMPDVCIPRTGYRVTG